MYTSQDSTLSIIINVIIIITTIICLTNQPIQLFSRLFARYHSNQYNLICVASVGRVAHVAWRTPKATIVLFGGLGDDAEKSAEIVPGEMACFLHCFVTKSFFSFVSVILVNIILTDG